ncbi:MAG: bifunctional 4-hydroxy-2-oxoglutarate aldolase/2-dehydro-3-deoxy-phosphogluconate aldolase [Deltaproteobacteria bacterium]|nr:bifunctional 4-hydroxy-2-oxoglutarate aldolase/2-dehydro-3-deoxy-phosphogluconate aldolase [Deltaproteobacteria bacterium]
MDKMGVLDRMMGEGLIPVVRIYEPQEAIDVAAALKDGGVSLIEITMTVKGALDVIKELNNKYADDVLIGAGTVLDEETGDAAILAGAQFLVSPNLNPDLIHLANMKNVVVIPGALSPTEIVQAWKAGADMVKIFPVAQVGGPGYIKALKGPLPEISFVPTGGVNLQNAGPLIRAGAAAIGVGGELIDKKAVAQGNFRVITENAKAFLEAISKAKGKTGIASS